MRRLRHPRIAASSAFACALVALCLAGIAGAETSTVRGERLLRTIWTPLRDTNPFRTSQLDWKVPQGVRGKLRFSVRSIDAAGNKSNRAWGRLIVR